MVKNKEREREKAWGPYNPSKGMPLMTFHEMPPLKCLNSLQSGDQAFKHGFLRKLKIQTKANNLNN